MTFSVELLVWFAFVVPGGVAAILSLRRARFVYMASRLRGATADVVTDAHHVASTALLLAIGWLDFLTIGVIAVLSPPPTAAPPTTPIGTLILWGLLGTVGVWSLKTLNDYIYTSRVWKRVCTQATDSQKGLP